MRKKYLLCPHNIMYIKCPICKDNVKDRRIDLLLSEGVNYERENDED